MAGRVGFSIGGTWCEGPQELRERARQRGVSRHAKPCSCLVHKMDGACHLEPMAPQGMMGQVRLLVGDGRVPPVLPGAPAWQTNDCLHAHLPFSPFLGCLWPGRQAGRHFTAPSGGRGWGPESWPTSVLPDQGGGAGGPPVLPLPSGTTGKQQRWLLQ